MKSDNKAELFPIVDAEGNTIGCATRGECHDGSKLLHPVVHLHLLNSAGEIYLQQRPLWKEIQPGKWDTAVGGHVDFGESILQALAREVREELGITEAEFKPLFVYPFRSTTEYELVNAYYTIYDGPISPDPIEVDEGKFWTLDEIKNAIGHNILTPNFEMEFEKVMEALGSWY